MINRPVEILGQQLIQNGPDRVIIKKRQDQHVRGGHKRGQIRSLGDAQILCGADRETGPRPTRHLPPLGRHPARNFAPHAAQSDNANTFHALPPVASTDGA